MSRGMNKSEYVRKKGVECPFCGSGDLDPIGGPPRSEEHGECWQEIECLTCHKTWRDVYRLAGYEPTENVDYYLLSGDLEPDPFGPFDNEEERDSKALELRRDDLDESPKFKLNVDCLTGRPSIHTYSGGFFDDSQ